MAAKAVATTHVLRSTPLVETVRLNSGSEENEQAVKGHRGEEDEAIQVRREAFILPRKESFPFLTPLVCK